MNDVLLLDAMLLLTAMECAERCRMQIKYWHGSMAVNDQYLFDLKGSTVGSVTQLWHFESSYNETASAGGGLTGTGVTSAEIVSRNMIMLHETSLCKTDRVIEKREIMRERKMRYTADMHTYHPLMSIFSRCSASCYYWRTSIGN